MNSQNLKIKANYETFKNVFLFQNSKLNLISKNDETFLYEKHFYDSIALKLFFEKYNFMPNKILDIGTGGGFPSVPLALEFPNINIIGVDSIRKKITAVQNIKQELALNNLELICDRIENLKNQKFPLIVSRAVAKISILTSYLNNILENKGYFVTYKSKLADEEIAEAMPILKKSKLKLIDIIEYQLPLEEKHERKLVVFQKTI